MAAEWNVSWGGWSKSVVVVCAGHVTAFWLSSAMGWLEILDAVCVIFLSRVNQGLILIMVPGTWYWYQLMSALYRLLCSCNREYITWPSLLECTGVTRHTWHCNLALNHSPHFSLNNYINRRMSKEHLYRMYKNSCLVNRINEYM